jgi:hypothetical protein
MRKLLLSAAAVAVLFTACNDDDTNPAPQPNSKYLLNIVSDVDSISVTYNANNKVERYEYVYPAETFGDYNKAVYENGKITEVLGSETSPTSLKRAKTLTYDATGRLLKINFYSFETGSLTHYDSLVYDNNGRLTSLYLSESASGTGAPSIASKATFVWDSKGNITKQYAMDINDGTESTDTITTVYTYDDKVNFMAKQPELYLIVPEVSPSLLSANNVLTEKTDFSDYVMSTTNTYTYDEDNYPATIKTTVESRQNDEVIFTNTRTYKVRYIKK